MISNIKKALATGSAEFNGTIYTSEFSDGSLLVAWVSTHGGNYYTIFDATEGVIKTNSKLFTKRVKQALAA